MLTIRFKPPVKTYTPVKQISFQNLGKKNDTSPGIMSGAKTFSDESKIRDAIIKNEVRNCPYKKGDICVWNMGTPEEIADKGDVLIESICNSYVNYGKDVRWPSHNKPFIVHASYTPASGGARVHVFCSVDALKKKP